MLWVVIAVAMFTFVFVLVDLGNRVQSSNRDSLILSSQNVVLAINRTREAHGVFDLKRDKTLTELAKVRVEDWAEKGSVAPKSNTIDTIYSTVAPSGDYYDVNDFISSVNSTHAPFLMSGTKVGAWVAYKLTSRTAKPIAYVTIIEVTYPTLSELIEACGEGFGSLEKTPPGNTVDSRCAWSALSLEQIETESSEAYPGSTPEQAVKNLWLALNKK